MELSSLNISTIILGLPVWGWFAVIVPVTILILVAWKQNENHQSILNDIFQDLVVSCQLSKDSGGPFARAKNIVPGLSSLSEVYCLHRHENRASLFKGIEVIKYSTKTGSRTRREPISGICLEYPGTSHQSQPLFWLSSSMHLSFTAIFMMLLISCSLLIAWLYYLIPEGANWEDFSEMWSTIIYIFAALPVLVFSGLFFYFKVFKRILKRDALDSLKAANSDAFVTYEKLLHHLTGFDFAKLRGYFLNEVGFTLLIEIGHSKITHFDVSKKDETIFKLTQILKELI